MKRPENKPTKKKGPINRDGKPDPFAALYPHIATWVRDGLIEMGRDDCRESFVRALDLGGIVWEGKAEYSSVHEALKALDAGIAAWCKENG